jgi:ABC-type multidrug transport system ATPase subunit
LNPVLVTNGLTKKFGAATVVDRLDLRVDEGELFGFLGPNGSGKTTTIRMLLGLVFATHGSIEVLGQPMPANASRVLANVGALVEGPGLYPGMSARRNLTLLDASGKGGSRRTRRARVDEVLERVGLAQVGRLSTSKFSLGMKQRLGLAAALLRGPSLLILDEPTNGLDPQGIQEIRALFLELQAAGTTIFVSSHLLTEVEHLCTSAAMLAGGRLVVHDTMARLLAPTGRLLIDTPDRTIATDVLRGLAPNQPIADDGHRLVFALDGRSSADVNHALVVAGVRVDELVVERRRLEDAYLEFTGGSGR